MRFTLSTKPFSDALNLGIIDQNITDFHKKSTVVQLTANQDTLRVNVETDYICTELVLRGSGDSKEESVVFVDSLTLKKLVSTLDSGVTTIEFTEGGIILQSGKSKFTMPKMLDAELDFVRPGYPDEAASVVEINKDDWKFVKDHQMYAVSTSEISAHVIYKNVYLGESGDLIVGDMDSSKFTHSNKNNLGRTCLIPTTIVNLFNSLPEGATVTASDKNYIVQSTTDAFEYVTEFKPLYENEGNIGSYSADIILDIMKKDGSNFIKFDVSAVNKFLNQSALLNTDKQAVVKLSVDTGKLSIVDDNIDCELPVEGCVESPYAIEFKRDDLKSVISNFDSDSVSACPTFREEDGSVEVVSMVFWTDSVTSVLAAVD